MRTTARAGLAGALALCSALGCTSAAVQDNAQSSGGAGGDSAQESAVQLTVGPDRRTFVELAGPSLVEVKDNGESSIAWDIALQGRDVFVNGGISGPGAASAFGPLAAPTYLSDTAPKVPFLLSDRAGGALLDWYEYVGSLHELFSRYHVYGLRDGARLFKLQVLSYYGGQPGAPVSALYHVRYAEVTEAGSGQAHDVADIDAVAGGTASDDSQPSGCLELDSEAVTQLTPAEAAASDAWQLCFRREGISVNGGLSGPRGMEAVDLQASLTIDETEAELEARTAASEQGLFDEQDFAALGNSSLVYASDGIVTAFGRRWLAPGSDPLALSDSVWLVIGADGATNYLLRFSGLSADPAVEPATLRLEAKTVLR